MADSSLGSKETAGTRRAKVFIHIGTPKTGSTAIQRFATDNRSRLLELGLRYPEAALRGFGHHDIAFLLGDGYPDWAKPQDEPLKSIAGRLSTECADFDGDILLSSENFYLFPHPEKLRAFLEEYQIDKGRDVKVIVYLRRQDDLFVSWYNQMVKAQGFSGTFDEALAEFSWLGDYDTQLGKWAGVFGTANLNVRRYPSADATDGGVMSDFWSVVCQGIETETSDAAENRQNIALGRDLLEIQRIINRLPLSIIEKRGFHHELMQLTAAGSTLFSDVPIAGPDKRRAILEQFASANAEVARKYFGDEPLFSADLPPQGVETDYEGLSVEKAIAALGWLLLRR